MSDRLLSRTAQFPLAEEALETLAKTAAFVKVRDGPPNAVTPTASPFSC